MKELSIIGYYGYNNLGDDIFLYLILKYIVPILYSSEVKINITVSKRCYLPIEILNIIKYNKKISIREINTNKNRFLRYFDILRTDTSKFILQGGGTFIFQQPNVQSIMRKKYWLKKLSSIFCRESIAIGIGIDPIIGSIVRKQAKYILNKFNFIIFRDPNSFQNAIDIGFNSLKTKSIIFPDLAYMLFSDAQFNKIIKRKNAYNRSNKKYIGVNFATYEKCNLERIIEEVVKLVKYFRNNDIEPILINVQPNKYSQEYYIHSLIKKRISDIIEISYNNSIFEFLMQLTKLNVIIGSKLHLLICSHMLDIPMIGLSYQDKVSYFMKSINRKKYLIDINKFSVFNILKILEKVDFTILTDPKKENFKLKKTFKEIKEIRKNKIINMD